MYSLKIHICTGENLGFCATLYIRKLKVLIKSCSQYNILHLYILDISDISLGETATPMFILERRRFDNVFAKQITLSVLI